MTVDMPGHFTMGALVRFTLPAVGMMLFMLAYVMVDGFSVSNCCGATALAAVNFAFPVPMILGTVGFMFGTGGSAIVSFVRTLVFEIAAVFLLPLLLGADGIRYSVSVAELAALVMTGGLRLVPCFPVRVSETPGGASAGVIERGAPRAQHAKRQSQFIA